MVTRPQLSNGGFGTAFVMIAAFWALACGDAMAPPLESLGRFGHSALRRSADAATSSKLGGGTTEVRKPGASCPPSPVALEDLRRGCPSGMARIDGGRLVRPETGIDAPIATYCLDARPVTAADYESCVGSGKCSADLVGVAFEAPSGLDEHCAWGRADMCDFPMNCVSWQQAREYCGSRSLRLPTEGEWRWAWQNGDARTPLPSSSKLPLPGEACVRERDPAAFRWSCRVFTHPRVTNRFGVTDLLGNVVEWIAEANDGTREPYIDGGSGWRYLRLDNNNPVVGSLKLVPSDRGLYVGFRCASDYSDDGSSSSQR